MRAGAGAEVADGLESFEQTWRGSRCPDILRIEVLAAKLTLRRWPQSRCVIIV